MKYNTFKMSFVRKYLKGEKHLLTKAELKECKDMPRFDELSVDKVYDLVKEDKEVLSYLPDKLEPPH